MLQFQFADVPSSRLWSTRTCALLVIWFGKWMGYGMRNHSVLTCLLTILEPLAMDRLGALYRSCDRAQLAPLGLQLLMFLIGTA